VRSRRSISIPPKPFADNHPYISFGLRLSMSAVLGVGLVIGVILAHDAFTYSDKHVDRVPCNPLSLHPRRGGKKNLPIIEVNLDAEEAEKKSMGDKPRLVIIGGGWGVSDCLVF
jgi:NADH dehydrogenase